MAAEVEVCQCTKKNLTNQNLSLMSHLCIHIHVDSLFDAGHDLPPLQVSIYLNIILFSKGVDYYV